MSSCSIRTIAKSGRCASISVAIASNIELQVQHWATPQRPCKIACSPSIADFGVQTPQGLDSQGSLLFFVDNRQLSYRMGSEQTDPRKALPTTFSCWRGFRIDPSNPSELIDTFNQQSVQYLQHCNKLRVLLECRIAFYTSIH